MKVRIGISLGPAGSPDQFAGAVDSLEQAGVDSLWLPETVYSPVVEPFTGMAFALARTRRLKAGSGISVLPGRHPVLVAKQLASLAGLAPGRVLPVFGLRPAQDAERPLFPVPSGHRAAVFDESLELLRLLLTTERVDFAIFTFSGSSGIDDTMVALQQAGRHVRGAVDPGQGMQVWAATHDLDRAGIRYWWRSNSRRWPGWPPAGCCRCSG